MRFYRDNLTTAGLVERVLNMTGMTQQQLGDVIGVRQSTISRWQEGGKMTEIAARLMDAIYVVQWTDERRARILEEVEAGRFSSALAIAMGRE